jgi:hypothetical protein
MREISEEGKIVRKLVPVLVSRYNYSPDGIQLWRLLDDYGKMPETMRQEIAAAVEVTPEQLVAALEKAIRKTS